MPDIYVNLDSDEPRKVAHTREVATGVNVDYDEHGKPIGVEVIGSGTVEVNGHPIAFVPPSVSISQAPA